MGNEVLKAARRKAYERELSMMRDRIRDSIAIAQDLGRPIPDHLQMRDEALTWALERIKNQLW